MAMCLNIDILTVGALDHWTVSIDNAQVITACYPLRLANVLSRICGWKNERKFIVLSGRKNARSNGTLLKISIEVAPYFLLINHLVRPHSHNKIATLFTISHIKRYFQESTIMTW